MNSDYNLCIIKPNKSSYSETFIQAHIDRLGGHKFVLYGGTFPTHDDGDKMLIKSVFGLICYLVQKKILGKQNIAVRTKALINYLKRKRIDIVLAEYGMVGAMVSDACKAANVPLIIHFHGADAHHRETTVIYSKLYQKAFKYATKVVAVSNDMVEALKKLGAPSNKLVLNPYGVDTSRFLEANVAASGINFLAIGRFVEKKSPLSVVEAFNLVVKKIPEARLWMVGDGPLLNQTKQFAEKLNLSDKITFTGVLSSTEIQALMQQMRCFVQHSVTAPDGDMEGTPNTILEASASALPVVSTRHAGIKEAVIDGVTGYLTPEYAIKGMAEGMIKLADSATLAVKLGGAGREHIMKNYDIKARIALLDSIIQNSIAKI